MERCTSRAGLWQSTAGSDPTAAANCVSTGRRAGGPPVRSPVRRGFGLELIERSVAHQLGGQTVLDYRAEGLVCEITVPLTDSVGISVSGAERSP